MVKIAAEISNLFMLRTPWLSILQVRFLKRPEKVVLIHNHSY
jgi:hypothetical protein